MRSHQVFARTGEWIVAFSHVGAGDVDTFTPAEINAVARLGAWLADHAGRQTPDRRFSQSSQTIELRGDGWYLGNENLA